MEKISALISFGGIIGLPIGLIIATNLIRNFNKDEAFESEYFKKKYSEVI
jgi:hypothetical protein